ncbi:tail fiber [Caudoviricetes sp.]|nr:tail fiber [Caudoviricetes sp.]
MATAYKNFAYSTVLTAPTPATSGTSLVVQSGDGTKFPDVPFNATIWPVGVQPITTNAEIVTVTAVSTDTFTIVRAQESTSARTVVVGDQIAFNITAQTFMPISELLNQMYQ